MRYRFGGSRVLGVLCWAGVDGCAAEGCACQCHAGASWDETRATSVQAYFENDQAARVAAGGYRDGSGPC